MFQLDEQFLESVGLGDMGSDAKKAFLAHIQEELEVRVGVRMSEGLTEDQLAEFERIIDGDKTTVDGVIGGVDLENDRIYRLLVEKAGFSPGSNELKNEYASIKWLTENRPDYQKLVSDEVEKLKKEIRDNKEVI